MKQLLSLALALLPCLAWAQYPSNAGQKITLGEQTTADGLVYRGLANDTNVITPFSDTSAYIILDTVNSKFYHYNRTTTYWALAGGGVSVTSFSAGSTGLTPSTATTGAVTLGGTLAVANGGTGKSTLAPNKVMVGNGTSEVLTPTSLHWNNSNGRLGIGTDSPVGFLSVQGTSTALGFFRNSSSTPTTTFINVINAANTSNGLVYAHLFDGTGYFGTQNNGSLRLVTADVEKMQITPAGRVGIGIISPITAILHLKASTGALNTAPLKFSIGTNLTTAEAGAMEFSLSNGANRLFISPENGVRKEIGYADLSNVSGVLPLANGGTNTSTAFTTGSVVFAGSGGTYTQDNSNLFWNNSTKRLGIGTSSPNYRIEVKSTTPYIAATGENEQPIFYLNNYSNTITHSGRMTFYRSGGTIAAKTTVLNNYPIGQNVFTGFNGVDDNDAGARLIAYADANWSDGSTPARFVFETTPSGSGNTLARMTIKSDGNVGIGQTTPSARLHVKGSTNASEFALKVDDSGDTNLLSVQNNGDVTLKNPLSVANGGTGATSFSPNNYLIRTNSSGIFDTSAIYEAGGKVSIGKNNPAATLEVARGSIGEYLRVGGDNASNTRGLTFTSSTTVSTGDTHTFSALSTNGVIAISTNSLERFRVASTGEVTINNLQGSGDRTVIASATGVLSAPVSSINTKENVQILNYGLNEILQINPVSFDYIDKDKWGEDRKLGFIVEDIYPIVPEVTGTMNDGDLYLDMVKLIPILTKAIQEQNALIKEQNALIKALEKRILILENK